MHDMNATQQQHLLSLKLAESLLTCSTTGYPHAAHGGNNSMMQRLDGHLDVCVCVCVLFIVSIRLNLCVSLTTVATSMATMTTTTTTTNLNKSLVRCEHC